ncbi:universal stress protein [Sporosarcina cascadiensis]|uniref:universal stress protein n=1 Tax=Sporosarcina cascadiensis TaxID=2660747 RepID=UPI00129BC3E3|nr:universal stress protein [Sporosarcina cascadiensis]
MKIAVAIDGSENAMRAAEHAVLLARYLPDAVLDIIFVADLSKAMDERLLTQTPESMALKREQKVHPVLKMAEEADIYSELTTLKGNPSQEIIKHVNSSGTDLLIMGSRGLNAFQEMVLGSVSHKVLKHANCPVTVVK